MEHCDVFPIARHLRNNDHANGDAAAPEEKFERREYWPHEIRREAHCLIPELTVEQLLSSKRNAKIESKVLARRVRDEHRAVAAHVDHLRGVPCGGRIVVGETNVAVFETVVKRANTVRFISSEQPQ